MIHPILRPGQVIVVLGMQTSGSVFFLRNDTIKVIEATKVVVILESKEAVVVIEASDVIMSDEVIEATEVFRTT